MASSFSDSVHPVRVPFLNDLNDTCAIQSFPASSSVAARSRVALLVLLLAGIIFFIDLLLPLGIAGGVPYVAPVLLTMWLPARRYVLPAAVTSSVLIVAGFGLSAPGAPLWAVIPNRVLALLAVWVVAVLALERRRKEDALAESEAFSRAVLDTTAEGILTLDADGRILSANPAAERIFGRPADELRQYSLGSLLGTPDCTRFGCDAASYLQETASLVATTREVVGRRVDGSTFPLELALTPLPPPVGVRYTATLRDVSERRLLEQYLLRTSEEERKAVGYGLHEELGQTLTGLSLLSRQLARRLQEDHPDEAREVDELAALLQEADAQALRLYGTLAPIDAEGSLTDALRQFIHRRALEHGITSTVLGKDNLPVTDELRPPQLYRVVHEFTDALLQHGSVRDITLQIDRDTLTLRFKGEAIPQPEELESVLQRQTYRARLIGARLVAEWPSNQEIVACCTL